MTAPWTIVSPSLAELGSMTPYGQPAGKRTHWMEEPRGDGWGQNEVDLEWPVNGWVRFDPRNMFYDAPPPDEGVRAHGGQKIEREERIIEDRLVQITESVYTNDFHHSKWVSIAFEHNNGVDTRTIWTNVVREPRPDHRMVNNQDSYLAWHTQWGARDFSEGPAHRLYDGQ